MCFHFEWLFHYVTEKAIGEIYCLHMPQHPCQMPLFPLLTDGLLGILYALCHIWAKIVLFFLSQAICLSFPYCLRYGLKLKYRLRMVLRVHPWLILILAEIHLFLVLCIWHYHADSLSKQKKLSLIPYIMSFYPWVGIWAQIVFLIDFLNKKIFNLLNNVFFWASVPVYHSGLPWVVVDNADFAGTFHHDRLHILYF